MDTKQTAVYLRREPSDRLGRCDVVAYATEADAQQGGPVMARWPYWRAGKPNRAAKYVAVNCYRYTAVWLDPKARRPF